MFKSISEIKNYFQDTNQQLIMIDGGDTFIGSFEELDNCFGIPPEELESWCNVEGMKFEVIYPIVGIDKPNQI